MIKPIYPDLTVLDLKKLNIHEICRDYIKGKYIKQAKLCKIETDSFIMQIKTTKSHQYISKDLGK